MTASKEDTAEREVTVVRDHQAENRRTLVDAKTVLTTTMMTTMMTVTIAKDQTSDTKRIAIAIRIDDGMIPVPKATTAGARGDLENHLIHQTELDTRDTDRGLHPDIETHSRVPAHIGATLVPELQELLPTTIRDLTNSHTTNSNTTQAEDTINHPTENNTISIHTSPTAPKDRHITNMDSGRISHVGYCNRTEVGLTPVPNILGNRYTTICLQPPVDTTNYGCTAIRFPRACKLNPSTGENLLKENNRKR